MSQSSEPVRFGIAGMGGYAASMADRLLEYHAFPGSNVRFVAACDPAVDALTERAALLRDAGVRVSASFDDLLADPQIDAVWLPLPIDLHRPFTERALAAGKHVVCEKPLAGSVDDVDAIIAARDRSGLQCLVGFQDVYRPEVNALKRQLVSGELGRPLHVTVLGIWPRPLAYFGRAGWAGRMKRGETWVLDSPVNNAMAHFAHLALYLLGPSEHTAATPQVVESELYRANDIENYDTCTIRATLPGGVPMLVAMTHASPTSVDPEIVITTDRTTVRVQHPSEISYGSGADRSTVRMHFGRPWLVAGAVARRIRGDAGVPVATPEMARAHTVFINGASEASPVVPVPRNAITTSPDDVVVIDGIVPALQACVERRQLLSETRTVSWARAGGRAETGPGYRHFRGPAAG